MKSAKNVIPMPGKRADRSTKKVILCRQDEADAVPFGSGDWKVSDVPGLILRAGATTKTWRLQRRIEGRLATRVLGQMTAAEARRAAMKEWAKLKPAPRDGRITLEEAWAQYLAERPLAPKTQEIYSENLERYLKDWKKRSLEELGRDRAGVRARYHAILRKHGLATASSVFRTFRAVYRYAARAHDELPPPPTIAIDIAVPKARDWALSDDELRQWWAAVQKLNPLKQTYWLTLLLTGARRDSVRLLKWADCDFEKRVIRFSAAKGGRLYSIPMSERLARILQTWQQLCAPSEWVFESPRRPGQPLSAQVRDDRRGVCSPHRLRHTARTTLAQLGCPIETAKLLLGHSLTGSVSEKYVTAAMLVEPARPWAEKMAERYAAILGWER